MAISSEGAGRFYRNIIFPFSIVCFFIALFGGFEEYSGIMIPTSICAGILGYFGPKIFGK
jgi:hypothetical protein